jgi:hypothetical protein
LSNFVERDEELCASEAMKKASEYRQHAAECRALAASMESDEQREQLLQMADHWEKLADDRARLVARRLDLGQEAQQGAPRDPH